VVLRGQYLERPALVACGPLTLEGLFHRGERPPALLCCPPLGAAGMDAPPLAEVAWACARAGHASLRFQHRGLGASEGAPDPLRAVEDGEAALAHLAACAPGPLAVLGLGTGCATAAALARAHPLVRRAVLLGPEAAGGLEVGACRALALLPEEGARLGLEAVRSLLSGKGRVEVVERSDALFRAGLTEAARRAVAFLAER